MISQYIENTTNNLTGVDETIKHLEILIKRYIDDENLVPDLRAADIALSLANLYNQKGNEQEAKEYYQKAIDWVRKSEALEVLLEATSQLADLQYNLSEINEYKRKDKQRKATAGYQYLTERSLSCGCTQNGTYYSNKYAVRTTCLQCPTG